MSDQKFNWRKTWKWVNNGVFTLLLLILVIMGFFMVSGKTSSEGVPKVGSYSLMVVLSGSMSPVFEAGDVIVVSTEKRAQYGKGDIITFKDTEDPQRIVTHRVIDIIKEDKQVNYRTKGDANNTPDFKAVPAGNVIGQQKWRIPYLGRLTEFVKTKQGFIFLIIVPGILIIVSELWKLSQIAYDADRKKQEDIIEHGQTSKSESKS